MNCSFCGCGVVELCNCGCAENGQSTYVCSNPNCSGDEFEILGVKQMMPCERCSTPVGLREIDMTEESYSQLEEMLKKEPNPVVEPKDMPKIQKVSVIIDIQKTIHTKHYINLKPSDIIRLLKYEGVEVPNDADFELCSKFEISEKYPLEIKWKVITNE